jgi:hypothetical protein
MKPRGKSRPEPRHRDEAKNYEKMSEFNQPETPRGAQGSSLRGDRGQNCRVVKRVPIDSVVAVGG